MKREELLEMLDDNAISSSALGLLIQLGMSKDDFNTAASLVEFLDDSVELLRYAIDELIELGLITEDLINVPGVPILNLTLTGVGHALVAEYTRDLVKNYWQLF